MVNAHTNAGLLVNSEIMGFPRLRRIFRPEVEVLQSQRNELVDLAERYLKVRQCMQRILGPKSRCLTFLPIQVRVPAPKNEIVLT